MRGSDDLKNLLDRLKGEVGPLPHSQPDREMPPPVAFRPERFSKPYRAPEQRAVSGGSQNLAWSENKESMLFGMLASLAAVLGGILAGLDYLVIVGCVFFSFFSLIMLLALFRVCLNSRRHVAETPGLSDRVDALSKKIEMLSSRAASGGGNSFSAGSSDKERELEQKVEELRVMVKSLTKAMG